MIKKINKLAIMLMITTLGVVMYSCEKDFSEQDNDLLAGKWRNFKTLSLQTDKDIDLMAYTEYAPYSFDPDKRYFKSVTYEYDGTLEIPYLRTTRIGHYTLQGDSLLIKDYKLKTTKYKILAIENDMLYRQNEKGEIDTFVRYDGSAEVGKNIQDVYYK